MIVVPKPLSVPHYHPGSAAARNHSLPTPAFQSGRLARARPSAPPPVPLPINSYRSTTITQAAPPSPSPKQPQPQRNLNNNRRRRSPNRPAPHTSVPFPVSSSASSHMHSQSLHGLGGDMDLVLDYADFTRRVTPPPITPPPFPIQIHRNNTFPSFFPHPPPPASVPIPTIRPPFTPTHSYNKGHHRSPSVPVFGSSPSSFPGSSSSFLGDANRYANSNFQNSPPPRDLPKPSFLAASKSTSSTSTLSLNDDDPFL